jgi:G:T-mismatch repair DNA endonuclease (very short patch repair protein)
MNELERLSATFVGGRRKNPDFVVLTKEQLAAYRAGVPLKDLRTYLVIEINGDFWHTKHKGVSREQREREFVDGYASIGVSCLVLWGSDIHSEAVDTASMVQVFLAKDERS